MIDLKFLRWNQIVKWSNPNVSTFVDTLYDETKNWILKLHKDWYINERFVRWDHWVYYNKSLWKIAQIPVEEWEIRRTVNKIRSQIRWVKNFIKRSQPRWQCSPKDWSDEAMEESIASNKILQDQYESLAMKRLMTDIIVNSLKTSVWILQVWVSNITWMWPEIEAVVKNSFEVMFDPASTDYRKWRFILVSYPVPVSTLKEKYSWVLWKDWEVSPDNKEWESEFWDLLEKERTNKSTWQSRELDTVIVKDIWLRWIENWKVKIRQIVTCKWYILDVYNPKFNRFPFFVYNPERNFNSVYSDPWIKDLISLNKSLDKTASAIEWYIHRMLGWKYLIKKWVEVSSITDKWSEKIYYKWNVKPEQMRLEPLPYTPITYTSNIEKWLEELWWQREASLWRNPWSLQSWKWIEALQAADAAVVSEPVENLEDFLKEVWEFILDIISEYWIVSKTIFSEWQEVKFVWKEWPDIKWVVKIKRKAKVKVVIVPEIAYSEEAKFERMMKMVELWIIDAQTVLEKLSLSNIADIMERVKSRKKDEMSEELLKQNASHWEWNAPADPATLADSENNQMAMWVQIPETPESMLIKEHTDLHIAFVDEFPDDYNKNRELFDAHIQAERQKLWI